MSIRTKPVTREYEDGWERTFGKDEQGLASIPGDLRAFRNLSGTIRIPKVQGLARTDKEPPCPS